jgi:hypothetical protein
MVQVHLARVQARVGVKVVEEGNAAENGPELVRAVIAIVQVAVHGFRTEREYRVIQYSAPSAACR